MSVIIGGVTYNVGDHVEKRNGYEFDSHIVAVFRKLDGTTTRIVCEDDRGILHIFNASQVRHVP